MKFRNERSSSARRAARIRRARVDAEEADGAIAARVQRAVRREAAQRLRDHRALHRVEAWSGSPLPWCGCGFGVTTSSGIAEIPAEAVEVAEDVAARARRLAVARGQHGVVEERPPRDDRGRLGVVQRVRLERRARGRVDHRDRVVEAREHVEPAARLVEHEAGRAAAGRDVARAGGRRVVGRLERRVLERRGAEHADLRGAERRDVHGARGRHDHLERRREAVVLLVGGRRIRTREQLAVVDVRVQVLRIDGARARIDHADARLGDVALHGAAAEHAGPLEARQVRRLGVRDVELPAGRVQRHVEQDRADVREGRGRDRRERVRVRPRRRRDRADRRARRRSSRGRARRATRRVGGSNFTIRLVSGAGAPAAFVLGPGRPPGAVAPPGVVQGPAAVKPSQTAASLIAVVWLPEWKAAT